MVSKPLRPPSLNWAFMSTDLLPEPPSAKQIPSQRTFHGGTVTDEYAWLAVKEDPDTIDYLRAENAYAEAATAGLDSLRDQIFDEIKARTKETDLSVPVRQGTGGTTAAPSRESSTASNAGARYKIPATESPPVLDEDTEIPVNRSCSTRTSRPKGMNSSHWVPSLVSLDGHLLAYSVDVLGDEQYTMRFRDLRTGERLPTRSDPGRCRSAPGAPTTAPCTT